jgi:glyoxylase-like metal-dependent hydrolase (beta-lactamase superfamily II)
VVRHPTRGTFIIDTGVERALKEDPDHAAVRGLVASVMHLERMKLNVPLGAWLEKEPTPIAGVLLTHLHLDHVTGMAEVPKATPVYSGPDEVGTRSFTNLFVRASIDRALEGHPPLQEWGFEADPDGRFDGVLDIFGDGSLWAIWVPGHTPGSTAYLARTKNGPVLFTGDASHTAWGWQHGVEPGSFSNDIDRSKESLARLKKLVEEHPSISVRPGHQSLPPAPEAVSAR